MKPQFVDTNIFLRFLTKDDGVKASRCFDLFQKAEQKEILLTTSESVIAEVVYVLSSKDLYNLEPTKIYQLLLPILSIKGLRISIKSVCIKALEIYSEKNIDFEDALSVAHMQEVGLTEIFSYDKDFDKFGDLVIRIEP